MDIYIGADHRGFELKQKLVRWLQEKGFATTDVGAHQLDKDDDYPDYASLVGHAVSARPELDRGVLLCGSGAGMMVVANKFKGVRAALLHDPAIAKAAKNDDDINVLVLGTDFIDEAQAKEVIETWLTTPFAGEERHQRRLTKIKQLEEDVCK
jgi:ribose 5-phosphate isomerase B